MTRASNPQDLPRLFLEGLNAGDVDAVVALYEADGVVAPHPSQVVAGSRRIRAMVADFLAHRPRFALLDTEVVRAGGLALIRARWTMTAADASGVETEMAIAPTLVARRQPEGHWLVVIDRPLPAG